MPRINTNGTQIHYDEWGQGRTPVVFAHGLLFSGRMFERQIQALAPERRCIALDFRGQGQSPVTPSGYDMETLTDDAAGLITELGAAPCHFVGLSMGGFVGMRLALRRPELLRSLTLLDTSAEPEPPENVPKYERMAFVARWLGLSLVTGRVMKVLFGKTFLEDPARAAERNRWRKFLLANDRVGATRATYGVIYRQPVYEQIHSIRTPTQVLVGAEDVATTPEKAERIAAKIPGARLQVIPSAGHSSTIENPEAVTQALRQFWQGLDAEPRSP